MTSYNEHDFSGRIFFTADIIPTHDEEEYISIEESYRRTPQSISDIAESIVAGEVDAVNREYLLGGFGTKWSNPKDSK